MPSRAKSSSAVIPALAKDLDTSIKGTQEYCASEADPRNTGDKAAKQSARTFVARNVGQRRNDTQLGA